MKRLCRICKKLTKHLRMKGEKDLIYCDECQHCYQVTVKEASWYDEDD